MSLKINEPLCVKEQYQKFGILPSTKLRME